MNKFKFYFILFCCVSILFSCNKSDAVSSIPIRDFDVQYAADIAIIEDYLTTHYLTVTNSTGIDDQNVEIKKIDDGQASLMSLLSKADGDFPLLRKKAIVINEKTYYIYYIKLREDSATGIAPSKADEVLSSYNGNYLHYVTTTENVVDENGNPVLGDDGKQLTNTINTLTATQFQYTPFPSLYLRLDTAIRGWREIFPLFKAGTRTDATGPNPYTDFGAGVLFIPSGFGYFSQPQIGIPSYSPLVFSFKLYDVKFGDQDGDGIISNNEDLNHDGDFTNDDTDGDGIQDLYDRDDDGDGYFTKTEIQKPVVDGIFIFSGLSDYYPYDPVPDNPFTTVDETEIYGVPSKFTGPPLPTSDPRYSDHSVSTPMPSDYTNPTRLRRYLDKTSFPPYK